MMTALVACFGLLPAAISTGIGSDSQKPFAIVIVGGLVAARCKHKAGQLPSGQLLVAGGSKEVEIFDRASGKFLVARGQMSDRWHFMTETRLRDGSVPLAGAAIQIAIRPRRRPGFTGSDLSAMICQP